MDYLLALEYATKMHQGQIRIGGAPYITHPIAVSEKLNSMSYGLDFQITALFHELLEDTAATEAEILRLSSQDVLNAVQLLTKNKQGYITRDYLDKIKNDRIALPVKLADRLNNLQCAVSAHKEFQLKYIKESTEYYIELSEDTPFQAEIIKAIAKLECCLIQAK